MDVPQIPLCAVAPVRPQGAPKKRNAVYLTGCGGRVLRTNRNNGTYYCLGSKGQLKKKGSVDVGKIDLRLWKILLSIVGFNKLFDSQTGLPDSASECAEGQLLMARYHTALVLPAHDYMAALLASLVKSKPDKYLDGLIS